MRRETAALADAIATFVCERLYDARLVPTLRAFRETGGSVKTLEAQLEAECSDFEPELETQLATRARRLREVALAAAIERTLGRTFGIGANGTLAVSASDLSRGSPGGLGTSLGRELGAAVGAAVTAGVSLVVATISGGFGHHLGAAILVGLLHTTGPVAFLIGGLGGLGVAAAGWYMGREQLAQSMKGWSLPRPIARFALRDGALARLSVQGREQCGSAVRERLDLNSGRWCRGSPRRSGRSCAPRCPSRARPVEEILMSEVEFTDYLGIRTLGMQDGAFVLELDLERRHMSRAQRVHGGVLFSLLDTALGRAVIERTAPGRGCATVELKINYFRPVQFGTVRASGRCVQKTKSLAYAEGDIVNGEGKLLARATGTFFITQTMEQPERERV